LEFGIRVNRTAIEALVAHARAAFPAECCGLLIGRDGAIAEAAPAANTAADPTRRFVVDPKDHIDGRRAARRRGLDVVGFYHSHPRSPAEPSAVDLAEASYADYLYLIVSLAAAPPDVRVFRLEAGNFLPLPFVSVP
jgi:proteasome lid subunit RPN8/RPN11